MDNARMLGRNIQLDMIKKGIDEKDFANQLEFSLSEVKKLLEGKLLIVKKDLEKIACALNETYDELIRKRSKEEYQLVFDCIGSFSDDENEDRILDMIDMYIEIKEKSCKL